MRGVVYFSDVARFGKRSGGLLFLLLFSGCATLVSGTTEVVHIETEPSGARVKVMPGFHEVETPSDLELRRGDGPYVLTVELDGYESQRSYIRVENNGWAWGNILLGGLIGILIDSATGSINDLEPNEIRLLLAEDIQK